MSAYHPIYNSMGTKNFSDGNLWHNTTVTVNSLYDCIANAGTGNGRPDSKEADKIYLKGENGLAPHSLFYAKDDYELPRDTFGLMSGSVVVKERNQPATVTHSYIYIPHSDYAIGQIITWYDNLGNYGRTELKSKGSDGYGEYFRTSSVVVKTAGVPLYVAGKQHPQLLTYGEHLQIDIIGQP